MAFLLIQTGKREVFEWLLREKIIDARTGCHKTSLLSQAIEWDEPELVKLLLQHMPAPGEKHEPVQSMPYTPTNVAESIIYAIRLNASQCFFELVKTHDFDPTRLPVDDVRWIEGLKIQQWLLEKGLKPESVDHFHNFLQNALLAGDNKHFLELLNAYDTKDVRVAGEEMIRLRGRLRYNHCTKTAKHSLF